MSVDAAAGGSLVEVPKDRVAIGVLGNNSGPVLITALVGSPLNESVEFASGVPTVVAALTAATLALVWRYRSKELRNSRVARSWAVVSSIILFPLPPSHPDR